jgi:H+-transporting ATPase
VFCTIWDDAPALSAAQVGIAIHGAIDAAKSVADLILMEPGLSPIYGVVLESRGIFARIKTYVIYRVAASLILALTLFDCHFRFWLRCGFLAGYHLDVAE